LAQTSPLQVIGRLMRVLKREFTLFEERDSTHLRRALHAGLDDCKVCDAFLASTLTSPPAPHLSADALASEHAPHPPQRYDVCREHCRMDGDVNHAPRARHWQDDTARRAQADDEALLVAAQEHRRRGVRGGAADGERRLRKSTAGAGEREGAADGERRRRATPTGPRRRRARTGTRHRPARTHGYVQKLHRDAAAKTRKRLHGAALAAQLLAPRPSPATTRAVKAATGFSATLNNNVCLVSCVCEIR
jgi:hypothetical protein